MIRAPHEEANLALVLGMFEAVLNRLDSIAVACFVSPDYIQHSQLAPPGRDALMAFLDQAKRDTPDAVHDLKRAFVDGDHVILHYHVRRWPDDSGFAVIDIFRVEDGMVAEHWDVLQPVDASAPNPNTMF